MDRAEHLAGAGQALRGPRPFRQPEIRYVWAAVRVHDDVVRLEIPVQHALVVDRLHGASDLLHQDGGRAVRQRARFDDYGQTTARHVTHRVVRTPFRSVDLVDSHHALVVDAGGRLTFRAEP